MVLLPPMDTMAAVGNSTGEGWRLAYGSPQVSVGYFASPTPTLPLPHQFCPLQPLENTAPPAAVSLTSHQLHLGASKRSGLALGWCQQ